MLQGSVLGVCERRLIGAFEFDAHGKVVAALAALEARYPGMPGPVQARDELGDPAVTLDQKVRRYTQVLDLLEKRMLGDGQAVLEERLHLAGAELPGRQADVVDHQQADGFALGARVEVGGRAMGDASDPASSVVKLHRRS